VTHTRSEAFGDGRIGFGAQIEEHTDGWVD
jgi:hypothetical protein